jgi:hypothetical protein
MSSLVTQSVKKELPNRKEGRPTIKTGKQIGDEYHIVMDLWEI